jgi:hypothetical protein
MPDADYLRELARECRGLAAKARQPEDKRDLSEMAVQLDAEAEKIESSEAAA